MYNYNIDISYNDDEIYRQELLKVFNLSEYNDDSINTEIQKLYETYKNNEQILNLINISKANWCSDEDIIGLMGLFAYDFFNYTHYVLKQINEQLIPDDKYEVLLNKLKSNKSN